MDAGNFFRHPAELVLRHQMRVSNYFVNSFYSVPATGVGWLFFPEYSTPKALGTS